MHKIAVPFSDQSQNFLVLSNGSWLLVYSCCKTSENLTSSSISTLILSKSSILSTSCYIILRGCLQVKKLNQSQKLISKEDAPGKDLPMVGYVDSNSHHLYWMCDPNTAKILDLRDITLRLTIMDQNYYRLALSWFWEALKKNCHQQNKEWSGWYAPFIATRIWKQ